MAVRSMTGYASVSAETSAGTLNIELKSVNSRFLDIQFRLGEELRVLEPVLREHITRGVSRGKVECRLGFSRNEQAITAWHLNTDLLSELWRMQEGIQAHFPEARPLSVNELMRWPGVIEESRVSEEMLQQQVQHAMDEAMRSFIDARDREGQALVGTLLTRVDDMEAIVRDITPLVPEMVAQFQQKAVERMQEVLGISAAQTTGGNTPALSQDDMMDRIRQEVTLYGMRIDVAEELSRLSVHLDEVRRVLTEGGAVGKRLDFTLQELNREANTLGSKAAIKTLSEASINLKLLIEQMREQVQNLE